VIRTLTTKAGSSGQIKTCLGQATGTDTGATFQAANFACDNTFDWEAYAFFRNTRKSGSTLTSTTTDVRTLEFAHNIATSSDPELANGQGDLFLTVAGSYTLSMARLIAVSFDSSSTPATCTATSRPAIQWSLDEGTTFQWVSAHDVEKVVVADLELSNQLLLQQHGASSIDQLKTMQDPADHPADAMKVADSVAAYEKNQQASVAWKKMLTDNEHLKKNAELWPEFYQSISVPGKAKGQVKQAWGTRPGEDTPSAHKKHTHTHACQCLRVLMGRHFAHAICWPSLLFFLSVSSSLLRLYFSVRVCARALLQWVVRVQKSLQRQEHPVGH
jgi:hypothetical protein